MGFFEGGLGVAREGFDHPFELARDPGFEVGFNLVNPGKLGKRPAAVGLEAK
ncbi:MAG TPA: hypothetical protein VMS21_09245 [Methylomirabilota bacterium]|nr:hypothetical protein [Methylomirabilota bacterium]